MSSDKKMSGKHLNMLLCKLVEEGKLRLTKHAKERMEQRNVTLEELCTALKCCTIEQDHCEYSTLKGRWTYSLLGRICKGEITQIGKQIRIVATFIKKEHSSEELLIITVIDLEPSTAPFI